MISWIVLMSDVPLFDSSCCEFSNRLCLLIHNHKYVHMINISFCTYMLARLGQLANQVIETIEFVVSFSVELVYL